MSDPITITVHDLHGKSRMIGSNANSAKAALKIVRMHGYVVRADEPVDKGPATHGGKTMWHVYVEKVF